MKLHSSSGVFSVVVAFMLYACGLQVQAAAASGVDADPPKLPRQVLVLNSHSVGIPWATLLNQSIIETFSEDILSGKVQLHIENTGLSQHLDTTYYRLKRRFSPPIPSCNGLQPQIA